MHHPLQNKCSHTEAQVYLLPESPNSMWAQTRIPHWVFFRFPTVLMNARLTASGPPAHRAHFEKNELWLQSFHLESSRPRRDLFRWGSRQLLPWDLCLFHLSFYTQLEETASLATLSISHAFSKICGNHLISTERLRLLFLGCFFSEYMWSWNLQRVRRPYRQGLQHLQSWIIEWPRALWSGHQPLQCLWKNYIIMIHCENILFTGKC